MLGRQNRQLDLSEIHDWRSRIPKDSFWWKLHTWAEENIKDEDFADLYSATGRPSVSPAKIVRAILVQLERGYSDRELEEASAFDDRVKLALGMMRNDPPLDAVTLCRQRKKLMETETGWQLLTKTTQALMNAGLFSDDNVFAVDSFLVHGAAARQDTITLIRKAIGRVLVVAGFHGLRSELEKSLKRSDYQQKGKPEINWDDAEERRCLVQSLVEDARELINCGRALANAPEELKQALDLLSRVAEQDITEGPDGRIEIKQGVAKDRIISVNDPEMRHGHKTGSYMADGYKGHVMVGGPKGSFVTAIAATPANATDASALPALLDEGEQRGLKPNELIADAAYGHPDTRLALEGEGIALISKAPPAPNRKGFFNKDCFEINVEELWVRCPGGQVSREIIKANDGRGRKIPVFKFRDEACQACPLKSQCIRNNRGRTVRLNYHEGLLQQLKRNQKSEDFRVKYCKRSFVERTIAHLTRHGARYGRYIGIKKIQFQLQMAAVVHNIKAFFSARQQRVQAALAGAEGVVSA